MAKATKAGTSTKPGTPDAKAKAVSRKRKPHPAVGNRDEKIYPFPALPGDFDFLMHALLKKKDFQQDFMYFEYKAAETQAKADVFLAKAEEAKKMGSSKERAKAKRLLKLQATMAELQSSLEEAGVDVDALLAAQNVS